MAVIGCADWSCQASRGRGQPKGTAGDPEGATTRASPGMSCAGPTRHHYKHAPAGPDRQLLLVLLDSWSNNNSEGVPGRVAAAAASPPLQPLLPSATWCCCRQRTVSSLRRDGLGRVTGQPGEPTPDEQADQLTAAKKKTKKRAMCCR